MTIFYLTIAILGLACIAVAATMYFIREVDEVDMEAERD